MTEEEWLSHYWPGILLDKLDSGLTSRKLRLLGCASFRRALRFKEARGLKNEVEIAERYSDGHANEDELAAVQANPFYIWIGGSHGAFPSWAVSDSELPGALRVMLDCIVSAAGYDASDNFDKVYNRAAEAESDALCHLVKDIFGACVHPVPLNPSWISPTVRCLAQAVYDNRNLPSGLFDNVRLGILADALEDAGCDNADILNHCRQPGEHVRGCWVVDTLTGRA